MYDPHPLSRPERLAAARRRRRRRYVETDDFGAFASRIVRAYGRRVGAGDLEALGQLVALRADLDDAITTAVHELNGASWRYSWAQIADQLGITRQSAYERFARRAPSQSSSAGG